MDSVKQLKKKLSQLLYNEAETRLTPLEATSALSTACSLLNQRPLILTAESTLEEKQILCPAYLTCSDLDLQNTSCPGDPKTWRRFAAHQSTLTQRASMVQERIEKFKKTFDTKRVHVVTNSKCGFLGSSLDGLTLRYSLL